uniref:Secreted protein n=2 Tax=Ixodes ricinus TaxID=34613 RepID=V5H409_IXORI
MMTRKCLAAAMAVFLVIMGAASVAHGKKLRKVAVLAGFYGFGAGVHLLGGLGVLHGLYSHYGSSGHYNYGYHDFQHLHPIPVPHPVPVPVPVHVHHLHAAHYDGVGYHDDYGLYGGHGGLW